jgi:hypothetical protein
MPSPDMDGEWPPALNLHMPPVDHLARGYGASAALGAEGYVQPPPSAAWGDCPGELGEVVRDLGAVLMEAIGFDAGGGGNRRTREGGTSALRRRRRLHGRSMGRRKGAPDVGPPRRGLPTPGTPDANIAASPHHHDRIIVPRRALHVKLAAGDGRGCSPGGSLRLAALSVLEDDVPALMGEIHRAPGDRLDARVPQLSGHPGRLAANALHSPFRNDFEPSVFESGFDLCGAPGTDAPTIAVIVARAHVDDEGAENVDSLFLCLEFDEADVLEDIDDALADRLPPGPISGAPARLLLW